MFHVPEIPLHRWANFEKTDRVGFYAEFHRKLEVRDIHHRFKGRAQLQTYGYMKDVDMLINVMYLALTNCESVRAAIINRATIYAKYFKGKHGCSYCGRVFSHRNNKKSYLDCCEFTVCATCSFAWCDLTIARGEKTNAVDCLICFKKNSIRIEGNDSRSVDFFRAKERLSEK